ncbi:MAG: nucleotidyltransferase domain-containing protein [archaeon]
MYQIKNNELKVVSLFSANYKIRFYLREISKLLKLPLKTCQDVLLKLENNKILKSKTEGKNKYFFLNLENIKTKLYLLQAEIYKTDLFLNKYPQLKIFLKSLKTTIPIIVFGSFAKFTSDKYSDLDLLIITNKKIELPYYLLPYKIHDINISENTFIKSLNKGEELIKEVEENHIILNNHSFYIDVIWGYYGK